MPHSLTTRVQVCKYLRIFAIIGISTAASGQTGPVLSSINPSGGAQGATVPVTLTGINFASPCAVGVANAGITPSGCTVISSTQITTTLVIAVNAPQGPANVRVTTPGGSSSDIVNFTVNPPTPTLTSISPNTGIPGTDVSVTLVGTNFIPGVVMNPPSGVSVVSGLTVISSTQITAIFTIAGNAPLGTRNVTVSTSGGTSNALPFTFIAPIPTLNSISPSSGSRGASVPVILTGLNFVSPCSISVANAGITPSGCTVTTPTQITATFIIAGNAALGAGNVTVTTPSGTSTCCGPVTFTVLATTLSAVPPNLDFGTYVQNGTPPASKNIAVSSTSPGSGLTFTVSQGTDCAWLAVTGTLTTLANLTASVNTAAATVGSHSCMLTFNANNVALPPTVRATLTVTPSSLLVLCNGVTSSAQEVGAPFSDMCSASGGVPPYSFSVSPLPAGLFLTTTATTATVAGAFLTTGSPHIIVTVTDSASSTSTSPILPDVQPAVTIHCTPSNGPTQVGVPYSTNCQISGGVRPFVISTTGNRPAGLSLDEGGPSSAVISGTPTTPGPYSYSFNVVDSAFPNGGIAAQSFNGTLYLPPTLSSITPPSGAQSTTVAVTLNGTNFVSGATTVNPPSGITVSGVTVQGPTQLTANFTIVANATPGLRNVTVMTAGGTSNPVAFTVTQPPTLSAISPNSAVPGTTVSVTLTGTNFTASATINAPGITVSNINLVSTNQITATFTIAGNFGGALVSVITSDGPSNALPFSPNTVPMLTSVNPNSGQSGTTVAVTLIGLNFNCDLACSPNGVPTVNVPAGITVSGVNLVSSTQITATFIIGSAATSGLVWVSNLIGGGATNKVQFTVQPSPISIPTSISPSSGIAGTVVPVTVTGTNFLAGASINVANSGVAVSNVTVVSATQITATFTLATNTTSGPTNVTITTAGVTSAPIVFTVNPGIPTLTSASPPSGAHGATIVVTLNGSNFVSGATINVANTGITVSAVSVVSATQLTATFVIANNATLGPTNVTATTSGGSSGPASFTVVPALPTISSIIPSSGIQGTSVSVTLTGTNFFSGATVSVSNPAIGVSGVTVVSPTQITATFNIGAAATSGPATVTVVTADGTGTASFIVNPGPPTLSSINPSSGAPGTAVPVTLTGTNFISGATINVANPGVSVSSFTVVNPTQITATFTIAATATIGPTNVTVTTSVGISSPAPFNVVATASPFLSAITPNTGVQGTTVSVTLNGSNFISGASINVTNAGVTVSGVTVVSPSQITAIFTIAANATTGVTNVTVATSAGTSGSVAFTVTPSSSPISVSPASLTFTYQPGAAVSSQPSPPTLSVMSTPSGATFTVTPGPDCSAAGISVTPASGTTPGVITISASPTGLNPGTYNCTIAVAGGGGNPQNVFVTFLVGGSLRVKPANLSFSYVTGGQVPAAQPLALSTGSANVTAPFTASPGCVWVTVNPASGNAPTSLSVSVNPAGLVQNSYPCTVSISGPGVANSQQVTVTLTVSSPPSVTPSSLSFAATTTSTTPVVKTIVINGPDTPVSFMATASTTSGGNWLSIDTTSASTPANIGVIADPTKLNSRASGTYLGTVSFSFAGSQQPVTVNVVLSVSPVTISAVPSPLQFQCQQSGALPEPHVLSISSSDNSPVTFAFVPTGPINVTRVPGSQNLTVALAASACQTLGNSTASIAVTTANGTSSPSPVPVTITVNPAAVKTPVLSVTPVGLTYSFVQGGAAETQTLSISNQGGGILNITPSASTASGGGWLSVACNQTALTSSASILCAVTADPSKVTSNTAGTYSGEIDITADVAGQSARIPVTMTVSALPNVLISRAGLSFSVVQGGTSPPSDVVDILGSSSGALNWNAQASTASGGNWLKVNGTSQATNTAANPAIVTVSADANALSPSLAAGPYYGSVVITATDAASGKPAANSPRTVAVELNVLGSGSYLSPIVRPSGLTFAGTAGATNVPGQNVQVFNLGSTPISYSSAVVTDDGGAWCAPAPPTGTVNQNNPIGVQVDFSKLAAGVHSCNLRLLFGDNSLQIVSVLAVATTPGGGATPQISQGPLVAQASPAAGSCNPTNLPWTVNLSSPAQAGTINAYQATPLEVKVVDGCTTPVDGANVSTTFDNGDHYQKLTSTGGGSGIYRGSWTPTNILGNLAQTTVFLRVVASPQIGQSYKQGGNIPGVAITVAQQVKNPTLISKIANSASYSPSGQVSPCSWVSIFGQNLADSQVLATTVPLGPKLGNASTALGGAPLPLDYVDNGQINAQIPCGLNPNTQLDLQVVHGDVQSPTEQIVVSDSQPALFTINQQGVGQGAIFWTSADGNHVPADVTNPVSIGAVVEIYCTGLGSVNPAVAEGTASPTSAATTTQMPSVTIGGLPAQVNFAGLTPGSVGLYQVNAVVPPNVVAGSDVPVKVTVGTQASQDGVTIAVK